MSNFATLRFRSVGVAAARRFGGLWGDGKGQPGVPALGPVLCREFLVAFRVDVALGVADRKQEADLRTDARPRRN